MRARWLSRRARADTAAIERVAVILALSGLPLVASLLALSGPGPSLRSPYPLPQSLLLMDGWPMWFVAGMAPVSYVVFNLTDARRPHSLLRRHHTVALVSVTFLSTVYFALALPGGIEYQGRPFAMTALGCNIGLAGIAWLLWIRWRASSTFTKSTCFSLLLHCWVFWMGFPYLGESP